MAVHFPKYIWFSMPLGLCKKVFFSKSLQRFNSQICLKTYIQRKKRKNMNIFIVSFSVKVFIVRCTFSIIISLLSLFGWIYDKVGVSFIEPLIKCILSLHIWDFGCSPISYNIDVPNLSFLAAYCGLLWLCRELRMVYIWRKCRQESRGILSTGW